MTRLFLLFHLEADAGADKDNDSTIPIAASNPQATEFEDDPIAASQPQPSPLERTALVEEISHLTLPTSPSCLKRRL